MNVTTVIPVMRKETRRVKMIFELKKDLQEDEVICEHCHGTGLEIDDNIYGISGDLVNVSTRFPYKNQSLKWCMHCYNGVQKKCSFCGSLRGKRDRSCSCGDSEKQQKEKLKQEEKERWDKAEKISLKEVWGKYECLYIENIDTYVFDLGELFEVVTDYELDVSNLRIYVTKKETLKLDADEIIDTGCEELHEDASGNCDNVGLQKLLDKWCEEQTGATTYYPDYKIGVKD